MPNLRTDSATYALLVNGNATGASVRITGGEYMVYFDGTISGATISLQTQSPSGQWMDVEVFTANPVRYTALPRSQTGINLPAGQVRCALSGGSPTNINAYLVGLG